MTLQPLNGFVSLHTHHCVTGSMQHVYAYNGYQISEELLLGLGQGVSFSYWHFKGQPPFFGGRGMPKPSMEQIAGQGTGVRIGLHTSKSARNARLAMLSLLAAGQPVMIQVDMGFLPYFDFGGNEYHFGGHAIVVCGYDPESEEALVSDRNGLHPVPMADLERARGSLFKPFPPHNLWYTFDFSEKRPPTAQEMRQAIAAQAQQMLEPPIKNIGVDGILLLAERLPRWPERMSVEEIRLALFNAYIFTSPKGGSGGGAFRYMFSRFLGEAAAITEDDQLLRSAEAFQEIGDAWESFADWCKQVSEASQAADRLGECTSPLQAIADQEQTAWETLSRRCSV
jgi:hypothetical protein